MSFICSRSVWAARFGCSYLNYTNLRNAFLYNDEKIIVGNRFWMFYFLFFQT